MSGWTCPACPEVTIVPSGNEIAAHEDTFRHRLRMLRLSHDDAERVALRCYEFAVPFEAALAAVREATRRPPGEYAEMAERLRTWAMATNTAANSDRERAG